MVVQILKGEVREDAKPLFFLKRRAAQLTRLSNIARLNDRVEFELGWIRRTDDITLAPDILPIEKCFFALHEHSSFRKDSDFSMDIAIGYDIKPLQISCHKNDKKDT